MDRRELFNRVGALGTIAIVAGSSPAGDYPETRSQGWVYNPQAVAVEVANLARQSKPTTYAATAAGQSVDDAPDDVFGWLFVEKVSGKPYINKDQRQVGDCVGFGTTTAIEAVEAAEIVTGDAETYTAYAEEVTYGGSRIEIGKGAIGRGDGSVGVWAAKFATLYGMVPKGQYTTYDLTTYSEATARKFGSVGVPADLEDVARKYPVKSFTQVKSADEAWSAIGNLNFIAVCSNIGYVGTRNSDGIIKARGTWGHCMCILGRAVINGAEYFFIQNSWGPKGMTGPIGYGDHPSGGFWASYADVNRMLAQGDSWTFSGATGFARKTIDWENF